jgi:type VI protein secretion system component Hcp
MHISAFSGEIAMAIDVYLQIDGIKGESQDDKHKDWIEVTGVHWGVFQPRSATASTGGGTLRSGPNWTTFPFQS